MKALLGDYPVTKLFKQKSGLEFADVKVPNTAFKRVVRGPSSRAIPRAGRHSTAVTACERAVLWVRRFVRALQYPSRH